MADLCAGAEELSDEEVFFGKMTLKEVKKHIWLNHGKNRTSSVVKQEPADCNASIQIIESHSQPNLRDVHSDNESTLPNAGDHIIKCEDNLVNMENMVSKMCVSPKKPVEIEEFNNTFEMVDYILNNGPILDTKIKTGNTNNNEIETLKTNILATLTPKNEIKAENTISTKLTPKKEIVCGTVKTPLKELKREHKTPKTDAPSPTTKITINKVKNEPIKLLETSPSKLNSPRYYTPSKSPRKQEDVFLTPSTDMLKTKTPIFKTPANPLSTKKQSAASLKFTPSKSPMFKHIQSPIASYIKGSVEVPMISNVCPKKPLPGASMIPKLVKTSAPSKTGNKENVNIPTTVFKSAKKTKVVYSLLSEAGEEESQRNNTTELSKVHTPVVQKPQSQSAKKLLATLPQPPVILKHGVREFSKARKPLLKLQEDSIADLSCAQADVSVCTQVKPSKKF